MEKALNSYVRFRRNVLGLKGAEKNDFWYSVYKKIGESQRTMSGAPFPIGIRRELFPKYSVKVRGMSGGMFSPGTVGQLLEKCARAYEDALYDYWARNRGEHYAQNKEQTQGEPSAKESD